MRTPKALSIDRWIPIPRVLRLGNVNLIARDCEPSVHAARFRAAYFTKISFWSTSLPFSYSFRTASPCKFF